MVDRNFYTHHMRKYFFLGLLFIVLAVLPSLHIFPLLEIYDEKRIFQVGLLLMVGVLFVCSRGSSSIGWLGLPIRWIGEGSRLYPPDRKPSVRMGCWGIAGFLALGFISAWINGNWYYGLQELSLYMLLLAFLFYTAKVYVQYPAQFNKGMVLILLAFGGFYVLKFFIGYGMHLFVDYPLWPGERYQNPMFGFANMRFLNQVQVWTLPLFLIWAKVENKPPGFPKPRRFVIAYFSFFLTVFWWCLIIRTASEGTILCLFVAPFIILLMYKEKCHLYIKQYLYAFISGVILKLLLFDLFTEGGITRSYEKATGMGRLNRWGKMIADITEQPILGFGPMGFAEISERYHAGHPHNSILQIGYEFGVPVMIIAVGLILWGLYRWYMQATTVESETLNLLQGSCTPEATTRLFGDAAPSQQWLCNDESVIRIGISTSLLAGLGYSLFSGVIIMPLSQLWMVLIGGWALGIYRFQDAGYKMRDKRLMLQKWLFRSIVMAAVVFMSYSMINDVPKLEQNQQHYIEEYGGKYHPRFWQQGKIGLTNDPL